MRSKLLLWGLAIILLGLNTARAQDLTGAKVMKGFFDLYYQEKEGKLYMKVKPSQLNREFLYVSALTTGLGNNDLGLDRGQLGNEKLVHFTRSGNKLLLVQPNMKFRAETDNPMEKRSVQQAFAQSVLFGFTIQKEMAEGELLIDLTPFTIRDAHGVLKVLKDKDQGTFKLDTDRSVIWMERTRAFPKNVEFEAMLTFSGEAKGAMVKEVGPDPDLLSLIQHHSFVELPEAGFEMRAHDVRTSGIQFSYYDYSGPIGSSLQKRYIIRHRLEKKDPTAALSEAVEPIVYYLDNGTPEPVRSALLEGASWWNQAFEAIGYKDAFRVEMLPDDADPLDVRYNVIQWVHRSTRGWSYGNSVVDPRTGEIIKGHVSLGSLRIRQDYLIAQALIGDGKVQDAGKDPMLEIALARIRQLSAHEVGHTLGFSHNFAASTNGDASVMDYPHPRYQLVNGQIAAEGIYDTGIGEWDKLAVAYAYQDFPEGTDEGEALEAILKQADARGYRYITDNDARARGGAHAYAHLWDNGEDAVAQLQKVMELRRFAIGKFSDSKILDDQPLAMLEDVFVPLYLYHRYQTEAAVKLVGGVDYRYAVKGQEGDAFSILPADQQRKALGAVLQTLDPEALAIPEHLLKLFPPRPPSYPETRESFRSSMGLGFDALGAASTASQQTLSLLFEPERANRLYHQAAVFGKGPDLKEVLDETYKHIFNARTRSDYAAAIISGQKQLFTDQLFRLMRSYKTYPQVKAVVVRYLGSMEKSLSAQEDKDDAVYLRNRIQQFLKEPEKVILQPAERVPDGAPIGSTCEDLW